MAMRAICLILAFLAAPLWAQQQASAELRQVSDRGMRLRFLSPPGAAGRVIWEPADLSLPPVVNTGTIPFNTDATGLLPMRQVSWHIAYQNASEEWVGEREITGWTTFAGLDVRNPVTRSLIEQAAFQALTYVAASAEAQSEARVQLRAAIRRAVRDLRRESESRAARERETIDRSGL